MGCDTNIDFLFLFRRLFFHQPNVKPIFLRIFAQEFKAFKRGPLVLKRRFSNGKVALLPFCPKCSSQHLE